MSFYRQPNTVFTCGHCQKSRATGKLADRRGWQDWYFADAALTEKVSKPLCVRCLLYRSNYSGRANPECFVDFGHPPGYVPPAVPVVIKCRFPAKVVCGHCEVSETDGWTAERRGWEEHYYADATLTRKVLKPLCVRCIVYRSACDGAGMERYVIKPYAPPRNRAARRGPASAAARPEVIPMSVYTAPTATEDANYAYWLRGRSAAELVDGNVPLEDVTDRYNGLPVALQLAYLDLRINRLARHAEPLPDFETAASLRAARRAVVEAAEEDAEGSATPPPDLSLQLA